MIEHALGSAAWDPSVNRTYDLDGMVFQLLGFDSRMNKLGQNPAFGPAVAGMEGVFARAAQRWFGMPKVVTGFLNFASQPAVGGLMLPGIRWLAAAVPSFDSYDWKYGLEENLIAFLHTCWERQHRRIASDASLASRSRRQFRRRLASEPLDAGFVEPCLPSARATAPRGANGFTRSSTTASGRLSASIGFPGVIRSAVARVSSSRLTLTQR
jgi:hypothetical protein